MDYSPANIAITEATQGLYYTPTIGPYESRDAIVEFISSTTEAQQDQRRHVITNVRLEGADRTRLLPMVQGCTPRQGLG